MQIANQVFIVTGAGSGLGAATAQRLVDQGARVVLVDMNAAAGQTQAESLGANTRFVQADVSDAASAQAAVEIGRAHV